MAESQASDAEILTHHLVLPRDANHHGTLYAGVLVSLALEAGYATAFRAAGLNANSCLEKGAGSSVLRTGPGRKRGPDPGKGNSPGSCPDRRRSSGIIPVRSGFALDGQSDAVRPGRRRRPSRAAGEEPEDEPSTSISPWSPLRERALKLLHIRQ